MGLIPPNTKNSASRMISFILNGNVCFQKDQDIRLKLLKTWQKLIGQNLELIEKTQRKVTALVLAIDPRTNDEYLALRKHEPEMDYKKHPFQIKLSYCVDGKKNTRILSISNFLFSQEQKEMLGIKTC